jgi:ABC-type phosphate/phosphonate transport system substrate-binding protein
MQAWHTQLTALARLTAESLQLLAVADLVLVQRLEALEAGLVGSALLLGPDVVVRIAALDNETVVALRGPSVRYAWLTPTALERQAFG